MPTSLRAKIRAGEKVIGSFIKTPSAHMVELLGAGALDYVVADREHAPIDLSCVDMMVVAAKSINLPLLVRVASHEPAGISAVFDLGCAGIVVPHVRSAQEACAILDAMKYGRGQRGFSPSARAGGYGTKSHDEYKSTADADSIFLAQIEDRVALDRLDEIAAVEDVDGLFIGPADLAASLGVPMSDPAVIEAIAKIVSAGHRHGKPSGIFINTPEQIGTYLDLGISTFACGSDQSMVLAGARLTRSTFDRLRSNESADHDRADS
jgi:2-keto-3-deoxy-L-rhamnonate aldolase RhmA